MTARRTGRVKIGQPYVCYLACRCCGHWWPLTELMFHQLIDAMQFVCPFCAQGRKKACDAWDWEARPRTMPIPDYLDVRVKVESKGSPRIDFEEVLFVQKAGEA